MQREYYIVVVWYTTTEQDALGYLKKMADMKDLILQDAASQAQLNMAYEERSEYV